MSTKYKIDREKKGLSRQGRNEEVNRLIDETERAIIYTRRFLAQTGKSQESSKEYIKRYEQSLESRLERLHDARAHCEREKGRGAVDNREGSIFRAPDPGSGTSYIKMDSGTVVTKAARKREELKDPLTYLQSELRELLGEAIRHGSPVEINGSRKVDFYKAVEDYERSLIETALRVAKGRQKIAAKLLRMAPSTLHHKLKSLGVDPANFQPRERRRAA